MIERGNKVRDPASLLVTALSTPLGLGAILHAFIPCHSSFFRSAVLATLFFICTNFKVTFGEFFFKGKEAALDYVHDMHFQNKRTRGTFQNDLSDSQQQQYIPERINIMLQLHIIRSTL